MTKAARAKRKPGTVDVPRPGKGELTRQRLIEQAAPVLNTRGFAGTAMSDLMAATGLQKGGIYRHFASKERLAMDALRYTLAAADRTRFEGIDPRASGMDQLLIFVRHYVDRRSPVAGGCPLLNTSVEHDNGIPAFREEAARTITRWTRRLAKMVRQGQREKQIRADTDPMQVAMLVLSTLQGARAIEGLAPDLRALKRAQSSLQQWLQHLRI